MVQSYSREQEGHYISSYLFLEDVRLSSPLCLEMFNSSSICQKLKWLSSFFQEEEEKKATKIYLNDHRNEDIGLRGFSCPLLHPSPCCLPFAPEFCSLEL